MTVRLLTGDCRTMLATLPCASVQMCVTSPPYFGLRDYGTASWQGGDAGCDHVSGNARNDVSESELARRAAAYGTGTGNGSKVSRIQYRGTCGKCGATRVDQQIGLESTVEAYVAELVGVFREVRRVLRPDGCLFLNLGDSYFSSTATQGRNENRSPETSALTRHGSNGRSPALDEQTSTALRREGNGLKPKDLIGIPWRVAFALQQPWLTCRGCGTENHLSQWASFPNGRRICPACELSRGHDISESGWYLRSDIVWAKPNPMPESVRDRPTKAHEYIFLLTKSPRYFWDAEAVREPATNGERFHGDYAKPGIIESATKKRNGRNDDENTTTGRNIRSVWTIATSPFSAAHFATFPPALAERCIKAGTSEKGACGACGAPWVRVVERSGVSNGRNEVIADYDVPGLAKHSSADRARRLDGKNYQHVRVSTDQWQPACACDAPIAPCVVLDPFGGAGTVSLVAERLGRDSIYVDLSPEYVAMARKRITSDAPLFAAIVSP